MAITVSPELAERIKRASGENVYLCYQCQKCTSGCPVAAYFDLPPHEILRACQFGQRDLVLNSRTIWLCAACETCTTRCPQEIDIAKLMDVLKVMAEEAKIPPKVPEVSIFYRAFTRTVRWFGRLYELGLMGEMYLRLLLARRLSFQQFFRDDLPLAFRLLRHGKLKLLPSLARKISPLQGEGRGEGQKETETIGYYPGCSLHGSGLEYDLSTRAVAQKLGLQLVEPPGWKCCGASAAHATDPVQAIALPVETLKIARQIGLDSLTMPCAACFSRFRIAQHELTKAAETNGHSPLAHLAPSADSPVRVESLLTTMAARLPQIQKHITKPLKDLRVVCYYGCLLTRPPAATHETDYEYPTKMDQLIEALGAKSLDWTHKTECCGGSLALSQTPIALSLSKRILQSAQDVGADAIVVACPLCHANLDLRQRQINEQFKTDFQIPILYFTQILGLALGIEPTRLGLQKHGTETSSLVRKLT